MDKASLRIVYKEKRRMLTDDEVGLLDESLLNQLKELDWSRFKYLHCYLAIEKFKEINTIQFIHWIWGNHPQVQIVISKSNFGTQEMEHFIFNENTHLEENSWGIPEPVNALEIPVDRIDAVICPLLVADHKGNRVGYGKGFYDRFLKSCRSDVVKIGLSYFEPIEQIDDVSEWDMAMNLLVTPKQTYLI
mgnify:CR=1 FL=1